LLISCFAKTFKCEIIDKYVFFKKFMFQKVEVVLIY
jgi:hypothetical protein